MSEEAGRGVPYGSIGAVLFCLVSLVLNILLFMGFKQTLWP